MEQVRQAYASVAQLYTGTVLDLGCGPGHVTDYLRSLDVNAMGIDLVPEFIARTISSDLRAQPTRSASETMIPSGPRT